jgi:hypothetical protein
MLHVTCECGWTTDDERDALITSVRAHCVGHHGRAAPTVEEILAVATPIPPSDVNRGERRPHARPDADDETET